MSCFVHMWFIFTWIQCLYEFIMSLWIHSFIEFVYDLLCTHVIFLCEFNAYTNLSNYVHLFEFIHSMNSLGIDTMAPKDAKKRMKAEQNKKHKLQTTTDPTPRKTVSNHTPSLKCKCSMQIKIFCGANNLFYLSKNSSLNHCHHHHLKSKTILCGQSDMETDNIDILTLLFSVNVTPTQISQIMEQLKGPESGTFMPKRVYNMNKKTE